MTFSGLKTLCVFVRCSDGHDGHASVHASADDLLRLFCQLRHHPALLQLDLIHLAHEVSSTHTTACRLLGLAVAAVAAVPNMVHSIRGY